MGVGTDGRNPPVPAAPTGRATPLSVRPDQQGTTMASSLTKGSANPGTPGFERTFFGHPADWPLSS